MTVAYVDTSVLTAIAFDEPGAESEARRLDEVVHLVSSSLLEAELRATFARENQRFRDSMIADIEWILPKRALGYECIRVLDAGYLRGADLWHLATALYVSPSPGALRFLTRDIRQSEVARSLGFLVPRESASI